MFVPTNPAGSIVTAHTITSFASAMRRLTPVLLVPVLLSLFTGGAALGGDLKKLLDLRGTWKFEVGDDMRWAEPSFSDKEWVSVNVPANWETQGFPGYDGYGWYPPHADCAC